MMIIPALLLALYAQVKVKSTFERYGAVRSAKGITAEAVSRRLLDSFGLGNVAIERVSGNFTDHYDPRSRKLRLSDSVGSSSSIAAVGVAAHEVGHAIQDKEGYAPLKFRNSLVPVTNFASSAAMPFFFLGILAGLAPLVKLGIVLFSCAVVFQLVTLPVEFDASDRALKLLSGTGILSQSEIRGAKSVLSAAALTYVAATLMAVMQLAYLVLRSRGRRN
jgi:Zn-dependent membrane protease YugP